jgi:hypothetical protein
MADPLRNDAVKAVLRELAEHGIFRPSIELNSKCIKIRWTMGSRNCMVTCGLTPSDHRVKHNARRSVRRELHAAGAMS